MPRPPMTGKSLATFILLCTLADFIFGCIRGRTLSAAIGHVFFGLLSTFAFLALWWWMARDDEPGD
jgi:hypothetical protein